MDIYIIFMCILKYEKVFFGIFIKFLMKNTGPLINFFNEKRALTSKSPNLLIKLAFYTHFQGKIIFYYTKML